MSYIVLDLEWNSAKMKGQEVKTPFVLEGEIIQIGAVKLSKSLEIVDTFNRMIKPVFYKSMNKRVQEVTLITDEDLEAGAPFESAINDFKNWCSEEDIIFTWGDDDIPMLEDNLEFMGLALDWIPESFDAQWMFDDQVTMEGKRYSLDYARFKFGIKGRAAHDALNDAYNTAEVIQHLDVAEWIQEERLYRENNDGAEE